MSGQLKSELMELDKQHFIHPTSSIQQQQSEGPAIIFDQGDGIYLKDIDDKKYIDGLSSLWNVNIGHGREELATAAFEQMKKMAFSSTFSTFSHEPAIRLTEKISSLAPENMNAVFLTSGGSEAVDSAIKIARHYWRVKGENNRRKIISRKRAYHGVSTGSTEATGIKEFWNMAGKMTSDFIYAKAPYDIATRESIQSIRQLIEEEGPNTIAALIAEPIQSAGGVIIPDDDYIREIRNLCNDYNILFIADEVITGFGRTGKMFGMENWNVVPDIFTFAKGVTSGYIPLGGCVVSDEIHDTLKEKSKGTLFHGFTYSGHPTACAVALKNIEIIENENIVENAKIMGEKMLAGFKQLEKEFPNVGNVRALGLLGAIELLEDTETNKRFSPELAVAPKLMQEFAKRGVICRSIIYEGTDIVAFAPPLIINEMQMDKLIDIAFDSVSAVIKGLNK